MSSLSIEEPKIWYREARRKETLTWSIQNFTNEWSIKMGNPDGKFQSPKFTTGRQSEYNWHLEFTPNSQFQLRYPNFTALKRNVEIRTKISFLTDKNDAILSTYGKKTVGHDYIAYTHSLTASLAFNKKKELLSNDILRIFIEIESNCDYDLTLYEQKDLIPSGPTSPRDKVPPLVKMEKPLGAAVKLENDSSGTRQDNAEKRFIIVQQNADKKGQTMIQQVQQQSNQVITSVNGKSTVLTFPAPRIIRVNNHDGHAVVNGPRQNKYVDGGEFSDITLDIQGKKLEAHRVILSNESSVFSDIFNENKSFEKIKNNTVFITNMTPEIGKLMLEFIYTNKISKIGEHLKELMVAAEKYKIERLTVICENEFIGSISIDTAIDALLLADSLGSERIKDFVVEFVRDNIQVLDSDKFKKIEEENSRLAMTIYRKLLMKKPKIE